jgi:hypothetical protein
MSTHSSSIDYILPQLLIRTVNDAPLEYITCGSTSEATSLLMKTVIDLSNQKKGYL